MTRHLGAAALAALTALALTACGADPEPEVAGGPVVLSSAGSLGAGGTESHTASDSAAPTSSATGGAVPVAAVVRDDQAKVDVDDQGGDGRTVRVREVRLSSGAGHVVVIDPRTREVLGTDEVGAGTARDLTVSLTRAVRRSGELVAFLYADDGDGRFDPATDGALVDDDREPVDEDFDYRLR